MITPTYVSNAQLEVDGYTVTIGSHQWDFTDGWTSFGRTIGATPYGSMFQQPYGVESRHREVRFVKIETLMDDLRHLSFLAGRSGALVKFTPDLATPGTFWWLNWPTALAFTRPIENRAELRVRLQEQSPGG